MFLPRSMSVQRAGGYTWSSARWASLSFSLQVCFFLLLTNILQLIYSDICMLARYNFSLGTVLMLGENSGEMDAFRIAYQFY